MRKSLFIIFTLFLSSFVRANEACCSCHLHLSSGTATRFKAPEKQSSDVELKRVSKKNELVQKVKDLLPRLKKMGLVTSTQSDSILNDLNHMEVHPNVKFQSESFEALLDEWQTYFKNFQTIFETYQNLSADDKKALYQKMKLPVAFVTSHFVTFLETGHLKFDYTRLMSVLKSANLEFKNDLVFYLFKFEKSVQRYFSVQEFLNCKS